MKINGEIPGVRPPSSATGNAARAGSESAAGSFAAELDNRLASTELTSRGKLANATREILESVPAVNEARVAAIRAAISEGRYAIDLNAVADKMLQLEQDL